MNTYTTDPARKDLHGLTGIYIRARSPDGCWGSFDIAELDTESLLALLQERPPKWSHDAIGIILGHGHLTVQK